jgi:hypothetical protein
MSRAKNSTQVLQAALWLLDNIGWVKNQDLARAVDGKITGFCAGGALSKVIADWQHKARAMERLHAVAPTVTIEGVKCQKNAVAFNDHPKTTRKQVVNLFKRAIKKGSK